MVRRLLSLFMMDTGMPFIYTGQSRGDIPRNVTHVKVHPAVKEISEGAFYRCRELMNVELCEGLERIDSWAFCGCTSLERIIIPSTVKEIGSSAFFCCRKLMNLELCEGLERIDSWAFRGCTSLERIIIPSTIKEIGRSAFRYCSKLMNLELCEGLERIDERAFENCTSLERIIIPSTVSFIDESAFYGCSGLVSVEFCSIEVTLPCLREETLRMYSLLAQSKIPHLLRRIKVHAWKSNIHKMLQPILEEVSQDKACELVNSRLSEYKHRQYGLTVLELALWKAKIMEQSNTDSFINVENDVKWMCHVNSWSMFAIIFPNVITFLSD
jgi:hypothetical protein